jgi:hypothetical protein
MSESRRKILDALSVSPMRPKQIAEESGVDHAVVKQLVRKMADEGDLDTDGGGVYTVHSIHRVHRSPTESEQGERSERVTSQPPDPPQSDTRDAGDSLSGPTNLCDFEDCTEPSRWTTYWGIGYCIPHFQRVAREHDENGTWPEKEAVG